MCGIGGWLGTLPDGELYATRLAQALSHRGPDANGIQSWPAATLIHTRLSIIDLSPSGAQPMANEDGTVWTTFNGEIYNHGDLRRELEARGHVFRGRSDTEVLPHLYEEEGALFVRRLRGMFALAVYDARTHTLLLARDRFGIKPLFYAAGPERMMFASEIRPLRVLPGIDDRPNRQAISDFAALFFIPAPATVYTGIRALQPGEILEARLEAHAVSHTVRSYHQWAIPRLTTMTLAQATDHAAGLVRAGVQPQMESDVPLGALLSGGIDSSLVSVAAQAGLPVPLRTFNVRFAEQEYDETWAAMAVAKHIGSDHKTLDMEEIPGTWEHITGLLQHAGQPFADTSLFAAHAVCKLMRQHVTVALSGDGGDEAFGGYNAYQQLAKIARWRTLPVPVSSSISAALSPLARLAIVPDRLPDRLRDLAGADDASVVLNLFSWVREQEHKRLCRDQDVLPVRRLFESQWEYDLPSNASRLERLSALTTEMDTRLALPNDYLFKVDIASMREGLEVRVPMLDEELFAFGLSLPHDLKVQGQIGKRVLREIGKSWLPSAVATKPKAGFAIPVDNWVNADFKRRMRDALLGASSRLPDFFRPEAYRPIVEAFCEGRPCPGISRQGLYRRAIMLLSVDVVLSDREPARTQRDHVACV